MAELMRQYRDALTGIVRDSQRRRTTTAGADAAGLAALLAAAGDGLFLHSRIDPELDSAAALIALRDLLTG
jgi:hypothetical protein